MNNSNYPAGVDDDIINEYFGEDRIVEKRRKRKKKTFKDLRNEWENYTNKSYLYKQNTMALSYSREYVHWLEKKLLEKLNE